MNNETFYEDIIAEANHSIAYWARGEIRKGTQYIWDMDEPKEEYALTPKVIRRGMDILVSGEEKVRDDIFAQICLANRDQDAIHLDADGVDVIIQCGIYGKVVFG